MAKILCVCISKERKTCSQNVHECEADLQGLVGDVHYGIVFCQILEAGRLREGEIILQQR